ncbi:DUF4432 family protein [Cohnella cellulosilytica]|uniref:DUF4432 family protein n=1 Tax=Cohnella cellulosilytica TaxID=986710 RepID=A0ABW2F5L1_9BACL
MSRNSGCRIVDELVYRQYRAVLLENEKIQILLLLDRGGEPARWLHKPSDTDFIWHTRMGLQPPSALYPDYQMSYPGGWQEMMPEVSHTHTYRGSVVHRGETAINPWKLYIVRDDPEEVHIRLTCRLRSLPLFIEKDMILKSGAAKVRIAQTVKNEAPVSMETNWGHHLAYGAPFLSEGARVRFSPGAVVQHPVSGKRWEWPLAEQDGAAVDLSRLPEAGTRRDLLAVRTTDGRYRIDSPERNLGLEVSWDHQVWPYVWYWQNYAADEDAPFFACEYNMGLEMFNVPPKLTLAEAAASGRAIRLEPFGSLSSWLEFEVKEGVSQ